VAVAGGNEVQAWDSNADSWSSTTFFDSSTGNVPVSNLVGGQGNFVAIAGRQAAAWNGGQGWLHTTLGLPGVGAPITQFVESLGNVAVAGGNEVHVWDSVADIWFSTTFRNASGDVPVTSLVGAQGSFVASAGDQAATWNGGAGWLHTTLGLPAGSVPFMQVAVPEPSVPEPASALLAMFLAMVAVRLRGRSR
jgi:hypothetical protein